MTDYPADLSDEVTLPDRRRVRIRALRRCEEAPIRELFAHLSPDTRYRRFLSPMPALPDHLVRQLACGDYRRQLALVAEYDSGTASAEPIGLASFGAIDDSTVEVALVVRDEWQRHQVGTELAQRLMLAAEARGFHRFIATVLSGNTGIRRLLSHVGRVVSGRIDGGTMELAFVRRAE